ncbi:MULTISPECIES: site-specific DNA-methyltransferase [unclassified Janthinobacterium]|uniref:site-specific DNA-methyltransferase n=1 Tax=unclassified Janthinobacterium TaxID=2610881 RepID=UPI00034C22C2|nr:MULTISPECIES: site-specific DNA-methyltransferase [unclassified Janthinobacterium]MEC5160579.1 adenine-specific DNA-methyltransferase [Janthinobacterium sp. CG_S6]
MAIGLNKAELVGIDSVRATRPEHFSPALPSSSEGFTISYRGKLPESEILIPVSSKYLQISKSNDLECSVPHSNGFIWGDNWYGLHSLIESAEKAQLIYLDPPYATGMDFASRKQEHAYNDSLGQSAYIEFMRRRLILMRELLEQDGSIYVHIGHQMVAELKLILDEIFGPQNFKNIIVRRKCSSKNSTRHQYANLNDYILFYTKSKNYIWNQPKKKATADWIAKEYTKNDERGQYKLVPLHAPGIRNGATGENWRGVPPPKGKHWQFAPSTLDELDAAGNIHWSKTGNPRKKIYLEENKGLALTDYWDDYRDAHHQSILITGYPTEKNFDMMKTIIGASSIEGGLVIDPFCGSGSTIHAAETLKRRWIGIDESFLSAKTVISRLQDGRQPMGDFVDRMNEVNLFGKLETPQSVRRETSALEFQVYVDTHIAISLGAEVSELRQLLR